MSDKKAQQVLKELFVTCRKLNISLCFLTPSYFSVPKDVRLNCTHYFILTLITVQTLAIKILLRFTEIALNKL